MTPEEKRKKKAEYMETWREKNRAHKNAYCKSWRDSNKEKVALSAKKSNEKHKDKCKERARRYAKSETCKNYRKTKKPYLSKYGVTVEQYNEMFEVQGGACKICTKTQEELGHTLHLDHSHANGKVRGLLCKNCNNALGLAGDSIEVLQSMINYLKIHE